MKRPGWLAAHRFGLGPRPGEETRISKDPKGWLRAQIASQPLPSQLASFDDSRTRLREFYARKDMGDGAPRALFMERAFPEVVARFEVRLVTETPFYERLVAFWSNHFTVSVTGRASVLAPVFEREAIRPHVFDSFERLLFAAVTHPAMLDYLDNVRSVGPNSPLGKRRGRDLNENLAREVLELHTLGVDGGYAQKDVEALAAVLSGWGILDPRIEKRRAGLERLMQGQPISIDIGPATYYPFAHEPGAKTILGKRYPEAGPDELRSVLRALAQHPSTARFIATKLARHFIADSPPPAAVNALANSFRAGGGNLAAVGKTLIELDVAWSTAPSKVKNPEDFVVSTLRALDEERIPMGSLGDTLTQMGQTPFGAPSPKGWPDQQAAWLTPEALMRRIEWANALGQRFGRRSHPKKLLEESLGPLASAATRAMVDRAPSPSEGIAYLFASREFQRR